MPSSPLRIGVLGAGAIGSFVGGMLAASGGSVVFVGRERGKKDFDEVGVTVSDLDGRQATVPKDRASFVTDPSALGACDVVLVAVKSGGTKDAAAELAEVVPRGALVVSLQNGVRNADVLREGLGDRATVLGGVVSFNVVSAGGGAFKRTTSGPLLVEASPDPRARRLVDALTRAGVDAALARDIRASQWAKLVINLSNAVGALSDVPTASLLVSPGYRRVMRMLIGEALFVLRRSGIRVGRAGPLPVAVFPYLLALPTPLLRLAARAQLKVDPDARSSMWHDLTHGRKTEVEELNGEIVRLARGAGTSAPYNERLVARVHAAEADGGTPRMSAGELVATLEGRAR
jgi:2-dehydropantoate 2-reductase